MGGCGATLPEFDPERALKVLHRHDVRYLVIGGIAAIMQGYPLNTRDLDVVAARDEANLVRLVAALQELHAKLRLPDGELEFPIEARFLGNSDSWTLSTDAGDFDVLFMPAGTQGYEDLRRDAIELDLGVPVLVASLRDVIRMKEASNRLKDQAQLPALRATLERIRERERARGDAPA